MTERMDAINTNSPLYEIRRPLQLLRLTGGFPLQTVDPSFSKFQFLNLVEYIRFAILIVIYLMEYIYTSIIMVINDGDFDNYFSIYEESYNKFSTSKIDKHSILLIRITAVLFSVVFLFTFKCNAISISELCKDALKLKSNLDSWVISCKDSRKIKRHCHKMEKSTKTIVYGQILNLASSMFWGIWATLFLQIHAERFLNLSKSAQIVYPLIFALQAVFILFGPMACSAELTVEQIIDHNTRLFSLWEDILKCDFSVISEEKVDRIKFNNQTSLTLELIPDEMSDEVDKAKAKSNKDVREKYELVELGLQLETLIIATNHATQGFIATIFTSHIVCLVFICYHVVSALGLNEATTGILKILQVASGSFAAAMYLVRLFSLMNAGQQLSVKVQQARRTFENKIILEDSKGINEEYKDKSYMLQKRLELYQYVAPISPYSVFGVNNKTFCATLATIVTYIVILIKLRGMGNSKDTSSP